VSQSNTAQALAAETLTQETKTSIRQVRTKTRRKYVPEDKIRIVLEGFRREVTVSDLCRREGIKPGVFYAWTKEFMEAGNERLTNKSVPLLLVAKTTRTALSQFIGQRSDPVLAVLLGDVPNGKEQMHFS
jgi:transposase-like protein